MTRNRRRRRHRWPHHRPRGAAGRIVARGSSPWCVIAGRGRSRSSRGSPQRRSPQRRSPQPELAGRGSVLPRQPFGRGALAVRAGRGIRFGSASGSGRLASGRAGFGRGGRFGSGDYGLARRFRRHGLGAGRAWCAPAQKAGRLLRSPEGWPRGRTWGRSLLMKRAPPARAHDGTGSAKGSTRSASSLIHWAVLHTRMTSQVGSSAASSSDGRTAGGRVPN